MKIIKANLKTGEETKVLEDEVRNLYGFFGGFNDVEMVDYMNRTGPIDDRDGQYLYLLDTPVDRRVLELEKEKIALIEKNKELKIEFEKIKRILNIYQRARLERELKENK